MSVLFYRPLTRKTSKSKSTHVDQRRLNARRTSADASVRWPVAEGAYPWAPHKPHTHEEIIDQRNRYEFNLDVSHFKPSELEVRVHNHNMLVKGRHEEQPTNKRPHVREFVRKYSLPEDVFENKVISALSNGILHIEIPKKSHESSTSTLSTPPIEVQMAVTHY